MSSLSKITPARQTMFKRFAVKLALDAGAVLRRAHRAPKKISKKGTIDLVTTADLASEKLITRRIEKEFPEHNILSEERTAKETGSDYRWVIDPLDGTINFAHGYPQFCVSIALQYRGAGRVGVVYDPLADELFSAIKGGGAFLGKRRIRVSSCAKLVDALCATGFPYDTHTSRRNNLGNFGRIIKKTQDIRRGGSAALDLCYLASGRFDGYWEIKLSPWDTAAGALIANEAGARVTDFSGGAFSPEMKEILAANKQIHRKLTQLLS